MAVLSLPLSFNNSFWSQDYRKGLEVLFGKLEQGIAENEEIIAFIMARAAAEAQLAASLLKPPRPEYPDAGFNADDGAFLLVTFRGLQAESEAQARVHKVISQELETLVVAPFYDLAQEHKKRLIDRKRAFFEIFIPSYEQAQGEVLKLKQQYLQKVHQADEAEDDAKFAPNAELADKYTASPRMRPHDRPPPQRTASVSDRITQRLREIQNKAMGDTATPSQSTEENKSAEQELSPKIDKGKGKAFDKLLTPPRAASPLPTSPTTISPTSVLPMVVGGLALPPSTVSALLSRAASELPLRPVRVPVMGEYLDCFTGEEFVAWLRDNVEGFGGSLDNAEDAARDLTERDDLLRRIGEFGNRFELSDDAFYQFRPKAFQFGARTETNTDSPRVTPAGNLLKRTGTLVSFVSKAISGPTEPVHVRAREEAKAADQDYRVAVKTLDKQRLALEDRIEDTLKTLQVWEADRLRAVKSVLLQYQGTLSNIPKYLEPSIERSATLVATYQPDADLTALIERYRTGPFRPEAQVYESISHDEFDVVFGIDLRKWAEGGWKALMSDGSAKVSVPPVLTALLAALEEAYQKLPSDSEKRKSWIYQVPLLAVHHLREALNAVPTNQPIPAALLAKYDAPTIASTIKLWLLELNPPLASWEGWEIFRKLYPHVGFTAKSDDPNPEEQHMQDLKGALQRLPMVHLLVLDVLLQHLRTLIDTTDVVETNEVYITKLALSLGRTIIRPKFESEISIQDRHPTLLFIELLKKYAEVIPPTIASKKRDSERKIPVRKRTAPVDMRLHRRNISVDADPKQLLFAQQVAQNPTLARRAMSPERLQPPTPPTIEGQLSSKATNAALPLPPVNEVPVVPPPAGSSRPDFKEPAPQEPDVSARPVFKEPVPDVEDFPPRPAFKEPSPEDEDLSPRPAFKSPPPEVEDTPRPTFKSPPPEVETSRPPFKEPSPELEDLPPRPTFKEPSPEPDDVPSRPAFKEPPPEIDDEVPPQPSPTNVVKEEVPAAVQVQPKPAEELLVPPTAIVSPKSDSNVRRLSGSFMRNGSPSPPKGSPRPTSPGRDTAGASPLSRVWGAATGTGPSLVRGPRMAAKGPRPPSESLVRGTVANLNRSINASGQSPGSTSPPKRLSSPSQRSSYIFGRSGSLSRRTMASDAEDDVVDRK